MESSTPSCVNLCKKIREIMSEELWINEETEREIDIYVYLYEELYKLPSKNGTFMPQSYIQ